MATSSSRLNGSTAFWRLRFCRGGLLQPILRDGIYQIYYLWEDFINVVQDFRHSRPSFVPKDDSGPQFGSDHLKKYLENGIEHSRSKLLWPQANGEIERQNRSILKRLRISQPEGRNWKSEMDKFLMMYRSPPPSTTGVIPRELLFGRRIRTKLPHLQEFSIDDEVRDRDSERKEKGKVYADCKRNACESQTQEGDKELLRERRKKTHCQHHTNSLPLQLLRRMTVVFLSRPMAYSIVEM